MTKLEKAKAKYMNERIKLTTMQINLANTTEIRKQKKLVKLLYREWMRLELKK